MQFLTSGPHFRSSADPSPEPDLPEPPLLVLYLRNKLDCVRIHSYQLHLPRLPHRCSLPWIKSWNRKYEQAPINRAPAQRNEEVELHRGSVWGAYHDIIGTMFKGELKAEEKMA